MLPLSPEVLLPVRNDSAPLTPSEPASDVEITIDPDEARLELPDFISKSPLVPWAASPLIMLTPPPLSK